MSANIDNIAPIDHSIQRTAFSDKQLKVYGPLVCFAVIFCFFTLQSLPTGSTTWVSYAAVLGTVFSPLGYFIAKTVCWFIPAELVAPENRAND